MTALRIAWFELRCRLRALSTYVYFLIFAALGFLWNCIAGGAFPNASVDFGAGGKVPINAPFSVLIVMMIGGYLGTVITAAIAGRATFQDIDHRTTAFFYTSPISRFDYLAGRYLGAVGSVLMLYPGITVGALLSERMPFIDRARVGPDTLAAFGAPYLTILLPNLIFTSAIFFALATLLRRMLPVYVGAVVLVLGYMIATSLTADVDNRTAGSLLDPFGGSAATHVTEYWTLAEKATRGVPLTGLFLANRALWMLVGLVALAFTFARFRFDVARAPEGPKDEEVEAARAAAPLPEATLDFSRRAALSAFWDLTAIQLRETVKNVFFLVLVLAGVLFVVVAGLNADDLFGTKTWLVTYEVVDVVSGTFGLFILIIIAFYAGDLVWRERDAGLAPIIDALPLRRWVYFTSKLVALMAIQVLLVLVVLSAGVLLQTAKGYTRYELDVYAAALTYRLVIYWIFCSVAMLLHVVVNHKYVGHFAMILFFLAGILLPLLGFEHRLYRVASFPPLLYSAMNGFGHFVRPVVAYGVYWGSLAVAFTVIASALWVRGVNASLGQRIRGAWSTRSRGPMALLATSLGVFALSGGYIYYETNVVGDYVTSHQIEEWTASYEKKYRSWREVPQPSIRSIEVAADLYPEERALDLRGAYRMVNDSGAPVTKILVILPRRAHIRTLTWNRGETLTESDASLGVYIYTFPSPIALSEALTLGFDIRSDTPGFTPTGSESFVVENGTFVTSMGAPHIGYNPEGELEDDAVRKKHGLAPRRPAPAGDPIGSMHNYVTPDSSWVDFEATVSTVKDQLPITSGTLDRDWTEGGRRFVHYRAHGKMLGIYPFLSARYAVRRDEWKPGEGDAPPVSIEIDYQPGHEFDLARMVKGVKRSLDYYTDKLGPYQHDKVRIVEFPRYGKFAESFPNTIPFSESIGFIARVDDKSPTDLDYPFYVTAHEVAHQWWAHQVVGGEVEGATMLAESLAQYSALMVMKHEYGPTKMKKFLRYELDRYLLGRSNAKRDETPLVRVENLPYIHYAKGSLAFYALAETIGEDTVDGVLARFLDKHRFAEPPYPDAEELVRDLAAAAPPEHRHVVLDLFETITLFDNRATSATATKRPDGKYDVTVVVLTKKLRADARGAETEIPVEDLIDVGALDKDGNLIAHERKKMTSGEATFTFVCDSLPEKAGVDPMNILIDRIPDDNVKAVETVAPGPGP